MQPDNRHFELYKTDDKGLKTLEELHGEDPHITSDSIKELLQYCFKCGFSLDRMQVIETIEYEYNEKKSVFHLSSYIKGGHN